MERNFESRSPRLLAIDDSVLIHRLLKARLKHEQLEIHGALSGREGLALARSLQPDVILLDVEMPDADGFQVLSQLKTDPLTHDVPVIFVSGTSQTPDKVRGLDMGAIDFIAKPFDIAELRARVRAAVRTRQLMKLLAQRAQVDGLTGLWNRAYFDQRLAQEVATSQRHSLPLSLMLCDIDRFKNLNDEFGHPFGDRVLEQFARILSDGRAGDVACRYGGEEFGIIMPTTSAAEGATVADRVRRGIEAMQWEGHRSLKVTCSIGIAELADAEAPTPAALVEAADQAMYAAKSSGRNRVESSRSCRNVRLSA